MEDDIVVNLGEIVVTANRSTGNFVVGVGSSVKFSGSTSFAVQRTYQDPSTGQSTGVPLPAEIAFQVTVLELMSKFLKAVSEIPGLPASDRSLVGAAASDFENAARAIEIGTSLTDVRALVNTSLEIMYSAIGDVAGGLVTASMMGAAGLTAASFGGVTGIIGGGLSFMAGYLVAESFPSELLADVTTDIIFLGADTIQALEQETRQSFSDQMRDFYNDAMDDILGDVPGARPLFSISERIPFTIGLEDLQGDFRFNVVNFADVTSAVSVNLENAGAQATGGAGVVSFATIEGIYGTAFDDTLVGNYAGNQFRGGLGNDYIDGGDGYDFADYSDSLSGIYIDLNIIQQAANDRGSDSLVSIEGIIGSDSDDVLIGNDQSNTLVGRMGNDTILAGGGDDIIIAHGFSTTYSEVNQVDGGEGSDTISFGQGTMSTVPGPRGAYTLIVDLELGTAYFGLSALADPSSVPRTILSNLTSIENVIGSARNDQIRGSAVDNDLRGEQGNDTIFGGAGDDYIDGGAGLDNLDGGDGTDTLSLLSSAAGVSVSLLETFAAGDRIANFENLLGSLQDDQLTGSAIANDIRGASGNDTIFGLDGDDSLFGGLGDDLVSGGAGSDQMYGDDGDDRFIGGGGTDTVHGGAGTDTLALSGGLAEYSIIFWEDGFLITDLAPGRDGQIFLSGIERLELGDGGTFDLAGMSGRSAVTGSADPDPDAFLVPHLTNPDAGELSPSSDWWMA